MPWECLRLPWSWESALVVYGRANALDRLGSVGVWDHDQDTKKEGISPLSLSLCDPCSECQETEYTCDQDQPKDRFFDLSHKG